ncbi:MAG: UDP-N-acetylmuramate--L-alanine ligase [Gammaproteobacteria bacterium]|nr:UDP-N-acetylmuramate--L-alanine ligase [Gammaproteobacteria bacterium]
MCMTSIKSAMRKITRLHFVGIGGTGMNGIAEVLLTLGYQISGSDLHENPATKRLKSLGAKIYIGHKAENISDVDAIVISTAVQNDNPEVLAARSARLPIIRRAEMLAELMRFRFGIAIAGTHGKTTTTSLVTSILAEAGLDPTYVIGGRLNSSGAHAQLGESEYFVAEADESDASFLYLQPMISIVTNVDIDHMETYQDDVQKLHQTFIDFLHRLPFYGLAILCADDAGVQKILPHVARPIITYGFNERADVRAVNVTQNGLQTKFTVTRWGAHGPLHVVLNLPGRHNVLNALSAIIVATELGVSDAQILSALNKFSGVDRRCQILGNFKTAKGEVTLIDDYGHHPRELAATQEAIKSAFPERRLVTVFQPHRYTRTKTVYEDFVHVLSDMDALVLLDIYSAGEEPIPGIEGRTLSGSVRQRGKIDPIFIDDNAQLFSVLENIIQDGDIILLQGAGNIGSLVQQLADKLAREENEQ